ncbi:telomere length regulation protein TEL2 homolog isoform X2 [Neocloeon triangulifer]|uniref:telomere length regulation protein TEL2 homolog isoform X2 n=1 Tax=Neocloeon triangulifer TaxID=2078957 RepID=UPI00286F95C7|nr:telomere length regulation protein TEL2 homolog isoform X2 [Neocloeon triangulifer]
MWKVREIADKVTNVVMNYTDVEAKVREATNDDSWGPTGQQMQDVAQHTFTYEHFPEVMTMLWRRMLQDNRRNWRRTYKSLLLLNYLVKNGSERVVTSAREHIYDLRGLENYSYFDENGKDQGINVRHKVKELIDFVQDDDRLREERKKAKKNKDKYIGMSSDSMGMRLGGGGGGGGWEDGGSSWGRKDQSDYSDWGGNNKNSDRFSDEGERYDSDGDVPSPKQPERSSKNEYKDSESIESPEKFPSSGNGFKSAVPSKNTLTTKQPTSARTIKKVDLGAAAAFAKEAKKTSPVKSSSDLFASVDDDFNPRASDQGETTADFGEFYSAVGTDAPTAKSEDDFADFHSAFSDQNSSLPAFATSNIPISTGAASNADLLMGLGSQLPTSAPVSLMSVGATTDLFGASPFGGPPKQAPMSSGFDDLFGSTNPLDTGNIPPAVLRLQKCQDLYADLLLLEANGCIEGPETPQKFMGLDRPAAPRTQMWPQILLERLSTKDVSPELGEFCMLAPVDEVCKQVLSLLSANNQLARVLEKCLREELWDFLIKQCRHWQIDEQDVEWTNTAQLFVSIPSRVGNILEEKLPTFCQPEKFSSILFHQFGWVISFLAHAETFKVPWREDKLMQFLSKLLINYGGTESAETFFRILMSVCEKDVSVIKVTSKLCSRLEGKACENLVTLCLLHGSMSKILDWKTSEEVKNHILVVVPFLRSHPKCNLPLTLIDTIATSLESSFVEFVTKVASIWANKSAISHTSLEQQIYLSEMLIRAANHLTGKDLGEKRLALQRHLMGGVSQRLQETSIEKKVLGMVVAEKLLAVCFPTPEPLKFDYDSQTELANHLNHLQVTVEEVTWDGHWLVALQDLFESQEETFLPTKELESTRISEPESPKGNLTLELDSDDEDDGFEAFDMSSDKLPKEAQPIFLREFLNKIHEQSADEGSMSLEGVAQMIRSQLPDDDSSLACELLDALLNLNLKKVGESVVAIIEVHPEEAVQHLAGQLGIPNKYSTLYLSCVLRSIGAAASNLYQGPSSPAQTEFKMLELPKNTRLIHSIRPAIRETKSVFAKVAPAFLYPLLPILHMENWDPELRVTLLSTLAVVMACSVNCPRVRRMSLALIEEIVLAQWPLQHPDAKIRAATLKCILTALANLDMQGIFECNHRQELRGHLHSIAGNDPEHECREWASKGLSILL